MTQLRGIAVSTTVGFRSGWALDNFFENHYNFPMHLILRLGHFLVLLAGAQLAALAEEPKQKTSSPPEAQTNALPKAASGAWEKLVMQPFHNNKGQLIVELPLPAHGRS